MKEICATCKYCKCLSSEWVCSNPDSDYCGCEANYDDSCFDWEEKE